MRSLSQVLWALLYAVTLLVELYHFDSGVIIEKYDFPYNLQLFCIWTTSLYLAYQPSCDGLRHSIRKQFFRITILLLGIQTLQTISEEYRHYAHDETISILAVILTCSVIIAVRHTRSDRGKFIPDIGLIIFLFAYAHCEEHTLQNLQRKLTNFSKWDLASLTLGLLLAGLLQSLHNDNPAAKTDTAALDLSNPHFANDTQQEKRVAATWRISLAQSPILLISLPQIALALVLSLAFGRPSFSYPSKQLVTLIVRHIAMLLVVLSSMVNKLDVIGSVLPLIVCKFTVSLADLSSTGRELLLASGILLISSHILARYGWSHKYTTSTIMVLLVLRLLTQHKVKTSTGDHPITKLRASALDDLTHFERREMSITSLSEAVKDYQTRYGRLPPPGFDLWYDFAVRANTTVISSFDQIESDLAPFWAVAPEEIRRRVYTAVQDRNIHISPLRIRNGTVHAPEMTLPTHYWLLEGLMNMMNDFVSYLPDMDIAINLDDEPRVLASGSYDRKKHQTTQSGPFTLDSSSWQDEFDFTDITPECFTKFERQDRNTFESVTRFCPPESPKMPLGSIKQPDLFVENWQDSLNICERPQLAHSRGYFVSPSSFDTCDLLLPIFSQSKPSTFKDILLPSPWDFADKVGDSKDEIPWQDKYDRLYWRGTPSEGWAIHGSWRKMLRQSMVDLLGGANLESTTFTMSRVPLYTGNSSGTYSPVDVSVADIKAQLDPDVFFVDLQRGDDSELEAEREHFHIQDRSPFTDHWRHRFLLDVDGVAFSGRFLAFMHSHSLPMKFTSVFTEWWSERVFAYQHFIPVTLESVYGAWSYFAGFTDSDGRAVIDSHQQEANAIAENGRAWAKRTLRKEDMVLYFWRLLLEYGRIVDDNRDLIGFRV